MGAQAVLPNPRLVESYCRVCLQLCVVHVNNEKVLSRAIIYRSIGIYIQSSAGAISIYRAFRAVRNAPVPMYSQ